MMEEKIKRAAKKLCIFCEGIANTLKSVRLKLRISSVKFSVLNKNYVFCDSFYIQKSVFINTKKKQKNIENLKKLKPKKPPVFF